MIKGDTPLNVKWLKNGVLIDPSQRISITQVDQYNSILVIEHLSASHSGDYSCVVSNAAADVESTQALLVNGKEKLNLIRIANRTAVKQGELEDNFRQNFINDQRRSTHKNKMMKILRSLVPKYDF